MKIHMLSQEVYDKIKAGEVIEDPSCVIRELLDNAIDAQATIIEIEIFDAGLTSLLVKDNGIGMSCEDLKIAFLEHTTSKITTFTDIFKIRTHGFRGEALASICKVAHVMLSSSSKKDSVTHNIVIRHNKIEEEFDSAQWVGTCIKVENLFYNMPVRRQFLKSKTKEILKIKKEILLKSLSYPHIRFSLKNDEKLILVYEAVEDIETRIIHSLKLAKPIHHFEYKEPSFSIKGFLTSAHQTFHHSGFLYFFINHIYLNSKSFFAVMKKALIDILPNNQYLGGVIFIETSPENIDPNVHPSKKEIKLFNEKTILGQLYHIISHLFDKDPVTNHLQKHHDFENSSSLKIEKNFPQLSFTPVNNDSFPFQEETLFQDQKDSSLKINYHYLGTLFGTYWLYEIQETLYIIDFHAAHERKRYEKLKKLYHTQSIESQGLLTKEIIHLSFEEREKLEEYSIQLKEVGFDFEILGDEVTSISAIPSFYENTKHWMDDLHILLSSDVADNITFSKNYFLKRMACRYSYMSQDRVPLAEMNTLIEEIFSQQFPYTCPHGRPFLFTLSKNYIESQFLRK